MKNSHPAKYIRDNLAFRNQEVWRKTKQRYQHPEFRSRILKAQYRSPMYLTKLQNAD